MNSKPEPYTKFIILGARRSGSTHLVTLLRSHPEILSEYEIFNPLNHLGYSYSRLEGYYHSLYQTILPSVWLRHYVYRVYPPIIRAVGFKILYHHMQRGTKNRIWSYLQKTPDIHIIHITRINLLKELISDFHLKRTSKAMLTKHNQGYVQIPIHLDPIETLKYFISIRARQTYYRNFFSIPPMLEITYESLTSQKNKTLTSVLRFLNVPVIPLRSECIKMNTMPLTRAIINYSELKQYFHNTPWISFFTE